MQESLPGSGIHMHVVRPTNTHMAITAEPEASVKHDAQSDMTKLELKKETGLYTHMP